MLTTMSPKYVSVITRSYLKIWVHSTDGFTYDHIRLGHLPR